VPHLRPVDHGSRTFVQSNGIYGFCADLNQFSTEPITVCGSACVCM
jgi:hypothetical protein